MHEQTYNERFKVCVRSLIYNCEKYISDCLRGFLMQETTFPVVYLLEDDASTDNTQEILRDFVLVNFNTDDKSVVRVIDFEGATTIFAQHRTNPNIYVAYVQMKYNHYGKYSRDAYNKEWLTSAPYIALCEGDDYWTDPHKLQKQVNFLDTHPEFVLCCHCYKIFNQTLGTMEDGYVSDFFADGKNEGGFVFTKKDNLHTWITKTMTLLYRTSAKFPNQDQFRYWRDVHLNYYLLKQGLGYCLPWCGAVYRRHDGGIFSPLNDWQQQKVGYLIMGDLLHVNSDDVELRDYMKVLHKNMLDGIRLLLQQHKWREAWERSNFYFKNDYYLYGVNGMIYSLKKMIHSYYYSLHKQ